MKTPDVVVIGGGAIGCSIAYYLQKGGLKATKAGIKPIIGTEAYIAAGSRFDRKQIGFSRSGTQKGYLAIDRLFLLN